MSVGFKMLLVIIRLVCLKVKVKFKNINPQTEADFAYYHISTSAKCNDPILLPNRIVT